MQIRVTSRNVNVPDSVREAIDQKIGGLSRFVDGMDYAEVVFREEKNPRISVKEYVEITIEGHGHHVRCKAYGQDQNEALDVAVEKLQRQLRKLKTRLHNRHHPNPHREREAQQADLGFSELPEQEEDATKIVRKKSFVAERMSAEAALARMELLEHTFYLFADTETGRPGVVYRREDGDAGVIDLQETG
ncbi:MAG: ribosome hibernation-promoting factor, HPF/YfiA family [Acidimicrobiales bacterium]